MIACLLRALHSIVQSVEQTYFVLLFPKGPKYLYGTKYGFCSSNFLYGLGKYSPYGYLGPFGIVDILGKNSQGQGSISRR